MEQKLREALKGLSTKVSQWKGRGLSEADTKRTLIEPLLAALGWDIHGPAEVRSDYPIAGGRVDYALTVGEVPQILVEAKALGAVAERDAAQLVGYAATEGVRWGVVTDGSTYELYDSFNTGALAEKLVFRASIEGLFDDDGGPGLTRLVQKLSLLSKQAMESGDIIKRAAEIKAEEERDRQQLANAEPGPLQATVLETEPEVRQYVASWCPQLETLYLALRSKIARHLPHFRAELAPKAGPGWVNFRNTVANRRRDWARFHLELRKREWKIDVYFDSLKVCPDPAEVERAGLRWRPIKTGGSVSVTSFEQVGPELMKWLEAAQ